QEGAAKRDGVPAAEVYCHAMLHCPWRGAPELQGLFSCAGRAAIRGAQERRSGNEIAAPGGPLSAFPSLAQEWQQGRGGPPPPASRTTGRRDAAGVQE